MKDELNGQMTRLRADCADRVCQLEKQLDLSNEHRTSSMFQMKEEVEIEYNERMETLREMYKNEIDSQAEKIEQQNAAAKEMKQGMESKLGIVEAKLKTSIAEYKNEIEELN